MATPFQQAQQAIGQSAKKAGLDRAEAYQEVMTERGQHRAAGGNRPLALNSFQSGSVTKNGSRKGKGGMKF